MGETRTSLMSAKSREAFAERTPGPGAMVKIPEYQPAEVGEVVAVELLATVAWSGGPVRTGDVSRNLFAYVEKEAAERANAESAAQGSTVRFEAVPNSARVGREIALGRGAGGLSEWEVPAMVALRVTHNIAPVLVWIGVLLVAALTDRVFNNGRILKASVVAVVKVAEAAGKAAELVGKAAAAAPLAVPLVIGGGLYVASRKL